MSKNTIGFSGRWETSSGVLKTIVYKTTGHIQFKVNRRSEASLEIHRDGTIVRTVLPGESLVLSTSPTGHVDIKSSVEGTLANGTYKVLVK